MYRVHNARKLLTFFFPWKVNTCIGLHTEIPKINYEMELLKKMTKAILLLKTRMNSTYPMPVWISCALLPSERRRQKRGKFKLTWDKSNSFVFIIIILLYTCTLYSVGKENVDFSGTIRSIQKVYILLLTV